jgi:hypothetical protein
VFGAVAADPLMTTRARHAPAVLIMAAFALAACGGTSTTAATSAADLSTSATAASPTSPAAAAATTPATATATTGVAGVAGVSGCAAPDPAIGQRLATAAITQITLDGGCHELNIATSLGDDVTAALAICDAAAAFVYTGKISSIRVESSTSQELAIGLKDSQCIGEP